MHLEKATKNDFDAFVKLEKEFLENNKTLGIDEAYHTTPTKTYFEEEFQKRLKGFFFFAVEDEPIGFIYGVVQDLPPLFKRKKVGYIDTLLVTKKYRGKGVATALKDAFFTWLKEQNVSLCQISVAAKNKNTKKVYEHWGFEPDNVRMIKEL